MTCVPWVNQSVTVHWNPAGVAVFGSPFGSLETLYPWRPTSRIPGQTGKYASAREHGMHALRPFYAPVLITRGRGTTQAGRPRSGRVHVPENSNTRSN
jgi:hypothetical protein